MGRPHPCCFPFPDCEGATSGRSGHFFSPSFLHQDDPAAIVGQNLLDGLDGLAGGVAAIIATSILVFSWIQGNVLAVVLMAAVVGAWVGFLRHNWAPARIYTWATRVR